MRQITAPRASLPQQSGSERAFAVATTVAVVAVIVCTSSEQGASKRAWWTLERPGALVACALTRAPAVGRVGLEPTTNGLKVFDKARAPRTGLSRPLMDSAEICRFPLVSLLTGMSFRIG